MYKKTITYKTYDEEPETIVEDFYFNLNDKELTELQFSGGAMSMEDYLNKVFLTRDTEAIVNFFKTVILKAYGKRSEDRRRFIKSQELRDEFEQSDAFNELFVELFSGDNAGEKFQEFVRRSIDSKSGTIDIDAAKEKIKETNPNIAAMIEAREEKEG